MVTKIILTDDSGNHIFSMDPEVKDIKQEQEEVEEIFLQEFKKFFDEESFEYEENKEWLWGTLLRRWDIQDIDTKDIQKIIRQGYLTLEAAKFEYYESLPYEYHFI